VRTRQGLVVFALLAALVPRAEAQPPSFAIEKFAVTLEVEANATLRVREAITFEFHGTHQGVFRTIPLRYERRGLQFALRVEDIHASDDNVKPLPTEVSRLGRGIRIKVLVPGASNATKTVIITYRVRRALIDVDDHEELYWNVTGTEWDVPIRQVEAVVASPPSIPLDRVTAFAYTGSRGVAGTDYNEERADNFITFRTTRPLRPREGLTVAVGWPPGAIRGPGVIQRTWWFLGDNWPLALPLLALGGVFFVWRLYGRDPGGPRVIKPEYRPPDDLIPATGGALVSERAMPRDAVATLVDLAVRGFIRIEALDDGADYIIHRAKAYADDPALRPLERSLLSRFFGHDGTLPARRLSEVRRDYDNVFAPMRDDIYRTMVKDGLFPSSPERVRALWLFGGLFILGAGLFVLTGGAGWFVRSPVLLGAGLALSGLVVAVFSPFLPRKTLHGAQVMAQLQGFREFLERTSQDELRRMPRDTMHKWLAWAIALGVSERWIHAFDGLPVSEPGWMTHYGDLDVGRLERDLWRFGSSVEEALSTSRRGGRNTWSGGGGTSGGSSGGV